MCGLCFWHNAQSTWPIYYRLVDLYIKYIPQPTPALSNSLFFPLSLKYFSRSIIAVVLLYILHFVLSSLRLYSYFARSEFRSDNTCLDISNAIFWHSMGWSVELRVVFYTGNYFSRQGEQNERCPRHSEKSRALVDCSWNWQALHFDAVWRGKARERTRDWPDLSKLLFACYCSSL